MKRKYSFIYETVLGVLRETYLQATAVFTVWPWRWPWLRVVEKPFRPPTVASRKGKLVANVIWKFV